MSDDDRIAYLAGDDDAAPDDRAGLDDLRDLLADPSLWAAPPTGLEDRVAAAVALEAAAAGAGAAPAAPPMAPARRHTAPWRLLGVAAALVLAVGVAVSVTRDGDGGGERFAMALAAPAGAPAAVGQASLERTDSGWRIELDAPGLPRLDGGRFYQAWLRDAAGTLVPIGSFNEGDDVVLWAGVSPRDFPTLTVTAESADGDQASSGRRVLVGTIAG